MKILRSLVSLLLASVALSAATVKIPVTDLTSSFTITYTGTLVVPPVMTPVSAPMLLMGASGSVQTLTSLKSAILVFTEGDSNNGALVPGYGVTTLSFDDLQATTNTLSIARLNRLTTLSFPELIIAGGGFSPNACASLTSISAPKLKYCAGGFSAGQNCPLITTLSFPALEIITGGFSPQTMIGLTSWSFPALRIIGNSFNPLGLSALLNIDFPALEYLASFNIQGGHTSVTTITMPNLIGVAGAFNANSGNLTALTTTTSLFTVGTLKSIGGDVNFSGCALSQASVDHILAAVASLDGTNGTTSWGTGRTLTLSGGTNSTPSAAGLLDKAIIVARGATVNNN